MLRRQTTFFASLLIFLGSCGTSAPVEMAALKASGMLCTGAECGAQHSFVHIEADPPPQSGYLRQHVLNVPVSGDYLGDLTLKPKVTFNGRLKNDPFAATDSPCIRGAMPGPDKPDMVRDIIAIPATIDERVPNADDTIIGQKDSTHATSEGDKAFRLELIGDQKYIMIVNPKGICGIPPYFVQLDKSTVDFDREISFSQKTTTLKGKINSAASFAGRADVRVYQKNHLVSAVGSIDADGIFAVKIALPLFDPESNDPLLLRIEPREDFRFLPLLSKHVSMDAIREGNAQELFEVRIDGPLQDVSFKIVNENKEPVRDARVLIKGRIDGYKVFLQTQTDALGNAMLSVYKGVYDVAVLPSGNEKDALRFEGGLQISSPKREHELILKQRAALRAWLFDSDGQPISGAQVQFTRVGERGLTIQNGPLSETSIQLPAQSIASGELCSASTGNACGALFLDDGRYEVLINPPDGSRFPYHKTIIDFQGSDLHITVPKTRSVSGRLLDAKGNGLAKTVVRIYSASSRDLIDNPLLIGQAYTDADGNFHSFIPGE